MSRYFACSGGTLGWYTTQQAKREATLIYKHLRATGVFPLTSTTITQVIEIEEIHW